MNMFSNTPSDRMQLVGLGELPNPATCIICGSGNHEHGYVDFRTFVEYHGSLLLCSTCLTQAAELIGMLTASEVESSHAIMVDMTDENERLKEELANATELLRSFDSVRAAIAHFDPAGSPDLGDEAVKGSEPEADSSNDEPADGGKKPESGSAEPVKGRGRSNSNGAKSGNVTRGKSSIQL